MGNLLALKKGYLNIKRLLGLIGTGRSLWLQAALCNKQVVASEVASLVSVLVLSQGDHASFDCVAGLSTWETSARRQLPTC